jgi:AcrR family transcriptional regulator
VTSFARRCCRAPSSRSRSRSQPILDAAEKLFADRADRGFGGTSLQEIGEAAGVARSTPAYFFGSKDALYLYEAVIERVVERSREAIAAAYERTDRDDPATAVHASSRASSTSSRATGASCG